MKEFDLKMETPIAHLKFGFRCTSLPVSVNKTKTLLASTWDQVCQNFKKASVCEQQMGTAQFYNMVKEWANGA